MGGGAETHGRKSGKSQEKEGDEEGMTQRDIVQRAFAAFGEDVQTDFAASKEGDAMAELPSFDAPTDLPGWGKWEGDRTTPAWIVRAREKAARQTKEALAARQDRKLKHVVISERYDKKSAKYGVGEVPFPFTRAEDYERSIRTPLGGDYNSDKAHRDLIRPSVLTTTGVRIDPITMKGSSKDLSKSRGKLGAMQRKVG